MGNHDGYTRFGLLGQGRVKVKAAEIEAHFTSIDQGNLLTGNLVIHLKKETKQTDFKKTVERHEINNWLKVRN